MSDTTYYLNKGKTLTFQGHQYFTHSSMIQYFASQHIVSSKDLTPNDQGTNGVDIRVLDPSKPFDDDSGLGGHGKNHLCIVTAQKLFSAHKGMS
jgi:hypothetical protein